MSQKIQMRCRNVLALIAIIASISASTTSQNMFVNRPMNRFNNFDNSFSSVSQESQNMQVDPNNFNQDQNSFQNQDQFSGQIVAQEDGSNQNFGQAFSLQQSSNDQQTANNRVNIPAGSTGFWGNDHGRMRKMRRVIRTTDTSENPDLSVAAATVDEVPVEASVAQFNNAGPVSSASQFSQSAPALFSQTSLITEQVSAPAVASAQPIRENRVNAFKQTAQVVSAPAQTAEAVVSSIASKPAVRASDAASAAAIDSSPAQAVLEIQNKASDKALMDSFLGTLSAASVKENGAAQSDSELKTQAQDQAQIQAQAQAQVQALAQTQANAKLQVEADARAQAEILAKIGVNTKNDFVSQNQNQSQTENNAGAQVPKETLTLSQIETQALTPAPAQNQTQPQATGEPIAAAAPVFAMLQQGELITEYADRMSIFANGKEQPKKNVCKTKCVRSDVSTLSTAEFAKFANALKTLNTPQKAGQLSWFARLVQIHDKMSDLTHGNDNFLHWHRYYLLILERKLQEIDSSICIPYWDWPNMSQNYTMHPVFSGAYLGSPAVGEKCIPNGPFAGFNVYPDMACVTRNHNTSYTLSSSGVIAAMLHSAANFSDFRSQLEVTPHSGPHVAIGGAMTTMNSSADPIFFLHHATVDKVWSDFTYKTKNLQHPNMNHRLPGFAVTVADLDHAENWCYSYAASVFSAETQIRPPSPIDTSFLAMNQGVNTTAAEVLKEIVNQKADSATDNFNSDPDLFTSIPLRSNPSGIAIAPNQANSSGASRSNKNKSSSVVMFAAFFVLSFFLF